MLHLVRRKDKLSIYRGNNISSPNILGQHPNYKYKITNDIFIEAIEFQM